MLENPFCFFCDSQNLKSLGIHDFNSNNIEIEELRCLDCGSVTRIPLQNKIKQLRENISNLGVNG